jgi:hypothetical protein
MMAQGHVAQPVAPWNRRRLVLRPESGLALRRKAESIKTYSYQILDAATFTALRQIVRSGNFTLVLGAGVSSALRLPLWNDLVDSLMSDIYGRMGMSLDSATLGALRDRYGNTILVRHLEGLVGFASDVRLLLRDQLYASFDESGASELLLPVCETFLQLASPSYTSKVITYNFDNALERQLIRVGSAYSAVFSAETYAAGGAGVRVYHPHGFLAHSDNDPDGSQFSDQVVFSERDYNEHFMDPSHWANVVQLSCLMGGACIFVGASLTDPNLRRLLDHSRRVAKTSARHISFQRSRGDQMADWFVETDLLSLGVRTLWVRNYDEIGPALRRLAAP